MSRRQFLRTLGITTAVTLLPILAGLLLWGRLPADLPIHWNAAGEIDNYASRGLTVFGLPALLVFFNAIVHVSLWRDPRSGNVPGILFALVGWFIPVLSCAVMAMIYASALGAALSVERVVPVGVGILLAAIGNYLPKCRPNHTVGIRIPWTLASSENWTRTHRFGGWLFLGLGLVMIAAGLCGRGAASLWLMPFFFAPILYSYILHRRGI